MPKKKEQNEEVEEIAQDDIAEQLAKLGAELQIVAKDKVARESKLKEIESVLGRCQVKDFEELAESPTIQSFARMIAESSGLQPGQIKNKGTLAQAEREWTWRDVGKLDKRKFFPSKTMDLTFNGLTLRIIANKECEVPFPFFDIYREHMQAEEQAVINESYLMGQSDQPPAPAWQCPEAALVRAHSQQGKSRGLVSGFMGVGPIIVEEAK